MIINILLSLFLNFRKPILKSFNVINEYKIEETINFKENIGIKLNAKSGIAVDSLSGKMLFEKNVNEILPIASITKLMTVLVFLENNPGWEKEISIIKDDYRIGGKLYVVSGEVITVKDLFYTSLVGSANNAAIALTRSTGMSLDEFVQAMNEKAKELEMNNTNFEEPTGLSENNVSTASDIAILVSSVLKYKDITNALKVSEHIFYTVDRHRIHKIKNTNILLDSFLNLDDYSIVGAKTGYTDEAGYCLAVAVSDNSGNNIVTVILGSDTSENRFQDGKSLSFWALSQKFLKSIKLHSPPARGGGRGRWEF
ncbi:D-alanyl-D-alanine carboxypeptidase family protein [Patescibacteria group bacterium]